ncbi:hypothetical protein ACFL31_04355 [Candidatus Margulisiibacteriota bacterium]
MRLINKILIGLVILTILAPLTFATDVNFPYANINLKVAPAEDPFPGFGTHFSTISKGMKSALWNPASLGKLELSETAISLVPVTETHAYQTTNALSETTSSFEAGGGMSAGEYALFYRSPSAIGSGISPQDIDIISRVNYSTTVGGANFLSALKVNDWITVGFASNGPVGMSMDMAGDLPLTARMITNSYGTEMGTGMTISTDGKLEYTSNVGGGVTTYESTEPLWSGFLSQEVTIPFTNLTEIRDSVNFESPYMGTIASKLGNLYVGVNMIPITATAVIDNDIRTIISSDATDQFLYVPNFDSSNNTEIANWVQDSDKYGGQSGYKRKQIRLPAGEIFATTKYRGYYSATTTRLDLGTQWDVNDWLTIGVALENFGGSALNFRGSGLANYINYREINTNEANSLNELMQPGGKTSFDLITDRWVSTTESGATKLYLEPEKTYALPKRLRYGLAFKWPWLIAIDYEQNQTPISYITTEGGQAKEVNISNLNFLRIGSESQIFFLPIWSRIGFTFMTKPTFTNIDAATQDSIDTYFQYGVFPVRFDSSFEINAWGTIIGDATAVNAMPLIGTLQMDSSNMDLTKVVFNNIYVQRDAWKIDYIIQADLLATGVAYNNKTVPAGETKAFEVSDMKYVQTLGVTYRF